MANWFNWCSCTPKAGRILAYLTDLVMALFVTTLTAMLLPMQNDTNNAICGIVVLVDILAILHLGSVWGSVLAEIDLIELPKLRMWFIGTGLIYGFFEWTEPYRCSFLTILILYYFISLLLTHTLKNAALVSLKPEEGLANHEMKEVKVEGAEREPAANAPLVEVSLNEEKGAGAENLELKASSP